MSKQTAIILIDEENKILLQHRDNISTIWNPNAWGTFGGGVKEGETFEEAIIRETREELDYVLTSFDLLYKYLEEPPYIVNIYIKFIKNFEKKDLRLLEGNDWGWFTLNEADKLYWGEGLREWKVILSILKLKFSN